MEGGNEKRPTVEITGSGGGSPISLHPSKMIKSSGGSISKRRSSRSNSALGSLFDHLSRSDQSSAESTKPSTPTEPDPNYDHEFSPHVWKPLICKVCFVSHDQVNPTTFETPLESKTRLGFATTWKRDYHKHLDVIRQTLFDLPWCQNMLVMDVSRDEDIVELSLDVQLNNSFLAEKDPKYTGSSQYLTLMDEHSTLKAQIDVIHHDNSKQLQQLENSFMEAQEKICQQSKALVDAKGEIALKDSQLTQATRETQIQIIKEKENEKTIQTLQQSLLEYQNLVTILQDKIKTQTQDQQESTNAVDVRIHEIDANRITLQINKLESDQKEEISSSTKWQQTVHQLLQQLTDDDKAQLTDLLGLSSSLYEQLISRRTSTLELLKKRQTSIQLLITTLQSTATKEEKNATLIKTEEEALILQQQIHTQETQITKTQRELIGTQNDIHQKVISIQLTSQQQKNLIEKQQLEQQANQLKDQQQNILAERAKKAKKEKKEKKAQLELLKAQEQEQTQQATKLEEMKEKNRIQRQTNYEKAITQPLIVSTAEQFTILFNQPAKAPEPHSLLDEPGHDIHYYRDNFLVDPRSYEELENAHKYFAADNARNILSVGPSHVQTHMNVFMVSGSDLYLFSIRQCPPISGILRTKIKDIPFLLEDCKPAGKDPFIPSKDILLGIKRKWPQFDNNKNRFFVDVHGNQRTKQSTKKDGPVGPPNAKIKFLPTDLLQLDRQLKSRHYKFGVIYQSNGTQRTAEELYANDKASPEFWQFMDLVADKIKMKDWRGYRGDLDIKTNATGAHSYFTNYRAMDCPLLTKECRARLLGNDVVVIVWCDDGDFDPSAIQSTVLHAFLVIRPIRPVNPDDPVKFKVSLALREGVEKSNPPVTDTLWSLDESFREFMMQKLINTERQAWRCTKTVRNQSKSLQAHIESTREGHLQYLYEKYTEALKEVLA